VACNQIVQCDLIEAGMGDKKGKVTDHLEMRKNCENGFSDEVRIGTGQ